MESALTARILRDLKSRGAWALKVHGSAWQRAGIPDILACVGGRFFAIEVKSPGKHPTPLQKREVRQIQESGGTAAVVETWEEYLALILPLPK
jgi:Holliday junction resolvase